MPAYRSLQLVLEKSQKVNLNHIPQILEKASLYLNHSIVIGEILDIETDSLTEILNATYSNEPLLSKSQIETLITILSQINTALSLGISGTSKAINSDIGKKLEESGIIDIDSAGRLWFEDRHLYLSDLHQKLETLTKMLKAALDKNIPIKLDY
jgi:hypothetical protein